MEINTLNNMFQFTGILLTMILGIIVIFFIDTYRNLGFMLIITAGISFNAMRIDDIYEKLKPKEQNDESA